MKKKLTVKDLFELKGKKKLVCLLAKNVEEALGIEKVGIEMMATGAPGKYTNPDNQPSFDELIKIREAAPSAFMHCGAPDTLFPTTDDAKRLGFKFLEHGIDMLYCHNRFEMINDLYKEGIPCLGHVGLAPSRRSWTGG